MVTNFNGNNYNRYGNFPNSQPLRTGGFGFNRPSFDQDTPWVNGGSIWGSGNNNLQGFNGYQSRTGQPSIFQGMGQYDSNGAPSGNCEGLSVRGFTGQQDFGNFNWQQGMEFGTRQPGQFPPGGPNVQQPPDPSTLFSQIDVDGDGSLTEEELEAGRPTNGNMPELSADQKAQMYSILDADGNGAISEEEFASARPPHGGPGGHPAGPGGMGGQRPDPAAMFTNLDADGDGTLTQEELAAGRPNNGNMPELPEEQQGEMYNNLDADGDGLISQEEFASAPPPPMPPHQGQDMNFGFHGQFPGNGNFRYQQ